MPAPAHDVPGSPGGHRELQSFCEMEHIEQIDAEDEHHRRDDDAEHHIGGEPEMERTAYQADSAAEHEEPSEPPCVEERLRPPRTSLFRRARGKRQDEPADDCKARGNGRDEPDNERRPVAHTSAADEIS